MHRGCMTDSKDTRLLCEQNPERCVVCDESGCNDRPLFVEPELSCFKCRDSTDCAYGQVEMEKLVNCTMPVKVNSILILIRLSNDSPMNFTNHFIVFH